MMDEKFNLMGVDVIPHHFRAFWDYDAHCWLSAERHQMVRERKHAEKAC
ncbi:MAG: hypothetical protein N2V77_02170 [Canidatus Methanoxibalbensis ujae]|nr:hypothetical protein [Candidatus Methanoxibalbensis ujae]